MVNSPQTRQTDPYVIMVICALFFLTEAKYFLSITVLLPCNSHPPDTPRRCRAWTGDSCCEVVAPQRLITTAVQLRRRARALDERGEHEWVRTGSTSIESCCCGALTRMGSNGCTVLILYVKGRRKMFPLPARTMISSAMRHPRRM